MLIFFLFISTHDLFLHPISLISEISPILRLKIRIPIIWPLNSNITWSRSSKTPGIYLLWMRWPSSRRTAVIFSSTSPSQRKSPWRISPTTFHHHRIVFWWSLLVSQKLSTSWVLLRFRVLSVKCSTFSQDSGKTSLFFFFLFSEN